MALVGRGREGAAPVLGPVQAGEQDPDLRQGPGLLNEGPTAPLGLASWRPQLQGHSPGVQDLGHQAQRLPTALPKLEPVSLPHRDTEAQSGWPPQPGQQALRAVAYSDKSKAHKFLPSVY